MDDANETLCVCVCVCVNGPCVCVYLCVMYTHIHRYK